MIDANTSLSSLWLAAKSGEISDACFSFLGTTGGGSSAMASETYWSSMGKKPLYKFGNGSVNPGSSNIVEQLLVEVNSILIIGLAPLRILSNSLADCR